ncbi:hypothetical protein BDW69DRAFT_119285 [Aspergillus filifer]
MLSAVACPGSCILVVKTNVNNISIVTSANTSVSKATILRITLFVLQFPRNISSICSIFIIVAVMLFRSTSHTSHREVQGQSKIYKLLPRPPNPPLSKPLRLPFLVSLTRFDVRVQKVRYPFLPAVPHQALTLASTSASAYASEVSFRSGGQESTGCASTLSPLRSWSDLRNAREYHVSAYGKK